MQDAVLVMEMRMAGQAGPRGIRGSHGSVTGEGILGGSGYSGPDWPGCGGRYNGPLSPQAATRPVAASVATLRTTTRLRDKRNPRTSVILEGSIMPDTEFLPLVDRRPEDHT